MLRKRSKLLAQLLLTLALFVVLGSGWVGLIFVSTSDLASASGEAASPHKTDLPLGTSSSQQLTRGQVRIFKVTLGANQFLRISVECESSVHIKLKAPNQQNILALDCRLDGPTPVPLLAETAGEYQLELSALDFDKATIRLVVDQPRDASSNDRQLVSATQLSAAAEALAKAWKAESSRNALVKFQESLSALRALGDKAEQARTLLRIGDVNHPLGEYEQALTAYEQSLSLARKLRDKRMEGLTLNRLGLVYISLGDTKKAEDLCTRALNLNRANGNVRGEAQSLANLGEVAYGLGVDL